ncbi:hypothetical protein ABTM22_20060, partial [Acinetobacter baumannii]
NAGGLAFAYVGVAPDWLAIRIPALLIVGCLLRLAYWVLREDRALVCPDTALRQMRQTELFAGAVSVGFTIWALALDRYGNAYQHSHVA